MQALARTAFVAGSSTVAGARTQRRGFAGQALRAATGNGSAARCRAFFKFGQSNTKDKKGNDRGYDSGVSVDAGGQRLA